MDVKGIIVIKTLVMVSAGTIPAFVPIAYNSDTAPYLEDVPGHLRDFAIRDGSLMRPVLLSNTQSRIRKTTSSLLRLQQTLADDADEVDV